VTPTPCSPWYRPEIEWNFSNADTWLEEQVYHGFDGIAKFFGKWLEEWDDYRFEVEDIIDAGDRIVAVVRDEGRGKSRASSSNVGTPKCGPSATGK
jgi:ketosteroid isomerase-like protein